MSQINVDTISGQTGNDISIASGKTLKDSSGNAFITSAGVLQVVTQQATVDIVTDALSLDITALDTTITPSSTSSAIMIACGYLPIQPEDRGSNPYWGVKLYRKIGSGSFSLIHNADQWGRADSSNLPTDFNQLAGYNFIDKPNTTSACVYRYQYNCHDSGSAENMGIGKGFTALSYAIEFSGATEV